MSFAKRRPLYSLLAVSAALAGLLGGAPFAAAQSAADGRVSAWSPSLTGGGPNFNNQTIRMVAHPSIDGKSLRIHLSNLRGTIPLTVGAADVAAQAGLAT